MSEFDEALARSVEDGIARGRLPGAADAVRRGRRRSLRARGGVTVLGVAVVAGALGGASALNGGAAGVGAGAGRSGAHADEGVLPVAQWPGYGLSHWKLTASCAAADRSKCRPGDPTDDVKEAKVSDWVRQCFPGATFKIRRFVQFGTQYDTARKLDADEIVFTFADGNAAAAFLAEARTAVAGKGCAGVPGAELTTPGVSTADGVSWLTTVHDAMVSYGHGYLARADDRVALLRVNQIDADTFRGTAAEAATVLTTFHSSAGDATVLAEMRQALER